MPWIYALTLSEKRNAGTLRDDWEESHPEAAAGFGVTVGGFDAVIVTTARDPQFADFESRDFVESISEFRQIPNRNGGWQPPYDAHPNGTISFLQ